MIGTGKKFAVQILDSSNILVERVILTANQGEISVNGLKCGETYYIAEETGAYNIEGYTIVGEKTVHAKAIQLEMPTALEGESVEVQAIVRNSVDPGKVPSLPDKTPKPRPVNVPKTGGYTPIMLYAVSLVVAAGGLTALLMKRSNKRHKEDGDNCNS